MENLVEYGLKNVHVAPITSETGGTTTYGVPFKMIGAVSLKKTSKSDSTNIYADDRVFFKALGAKTSEGSMEFIKLNEQFLISIMGYVKDTRGGLVEMANSKPKSFALLFQIDGDKEERRIAYYKCTAKPINDNFSTKKEKIEDPKVEVQIEIEASAEDYFGYSITKSAHAQTYNEFFTAVKKPEIRAV